MSIDSAKFIVPIVLIPIISSTNLPKTWQSGRYERYSGLSIPGVKDISGIIEETHSKFPCESIEPFGGPVVPDV